MASASFAWGFKAEAERTALELRKDLGIAEDSRLIPLDLAQHLHIPVISITHLKLADPAAIEHFLAGDGQNTFSAATLHISRFKRAIILNPAHSDGRQANSLCHELAHIVLGHESETPVPIKGGRDWNPIQEREADWLAGCLLIPAIAAARAARRGLDNAAVAALFGVSIQVASMRMNATGARIIASRVQNRRARKS